MYDCQRKRRDVAVYLCVWRCVGSFSGAAAAEERRTVDSLTPLTARWSTALITQWLCVWTMWGGTATETSASTSTLQHISTSSFKPDRPSARPLLPRWELSHFLSKWRHAHYKELILQLNTYEQSRFQGLSEVCDHTGPHTLREIWLRDCKLNKRDRKRPRTIEL